MRFAAGFIALAGAGSSGAALVALASACGGATFSSAGYEEATMADAQALEPGVDAGSGSFCQREGSAAGFCEDFEGPSLTASGRWDSIVVTRALTEVVTGFPATPSPPASLESLAQVSTAGGALGQQNDGRLVKAFPISSRIDLAFDLHLDSVPLRPSPAGGDSIVVVELGGPYSLGLYVNAGDDAGATGELGLYEDVVVDGGTSSLGSYVLAPLASVQGAWQHVEMSLQLEKDASGSSITLALNGATPVTYALAAPAGHQPTIELGASSRDMPGDPLALHYDNLTVTVKP